MMGWSRRRRERERARERVLLAADNRDWHDKVINAQTHASRNAQMDGSFKAENFPVVVLLKESTGDIFVGRLAGCFDPGKSA
jgi:hypothetical protein